MDRDGSWCNYIVVPPEPEGADRLAYHIRWVTCRPAIRCLNCLFTWLRSPHHRGRQRGRPLLPQPLRGGPAQHQVLCRRSPCGHGWAALPGSQPSHCLCMQRPFWTAAHHLSSTLMHQLCDAWAYLDMLTCCVQVDGVMAPSAWWTLCHALSRPRCTTCSSTLRSWPLRSLSATR